MGVDLIAFTAASAVLIVVPGVDFALVTHQVVSYGRRSALLTAVGLLVGGLCHAAFATLGLSALLLASAEVYTVVRLAGAAYLIWIGLQALRSGLRPAVRRLGPPPVQDTHPVQDAPRTMSARGSFVRGMLSDLLNVKVAIFFVTFLPQFVDPGPGAIWDTALLGLLFNMMASTWWLVYILLVGRLHRWLTRPRIRRVIDGATGTVLVGVGATVAVEH